MGKGFNNYMTKKFFHPASKDNIKRVWMAQQKTTYEKKKQEDLMNQYQKEQEMLSNRALLGDEKAKLGLSFLYDAPPGLKKKEKDDEGEEEIKFEWQRKYNAPREAYAKNDETIRDQPFGIEVRNVRCIKCRQWGHVNTDKICPLFGRNLTAEPPQPENTTASLLEGLKEDGFQMKKSILGRLMEGDEDKRMVESEDDDDPEVQFLKSLTPKQKKKLLKKLNKLQKGKTSGAGKAKKSKKEKKKKKKSKRDESGSDSSDSDRKARKKKTSRKMSESESSSDSSDEDRTAWKSRNQQDVRPKGRPEKSRSRHERSRSPIRRRSEEKDDSRHRPESRKEYIPEKAHRHQGHVADKEIRGRKERSSSSGSPDEKETNHRNDRKEKKSEREKRSKHEKREKNDHGTKGRSRHRDEDSDSSESEDERYRSKQDRQSVHDRKKNSDDRRQEKNKKYDSYSESDSKSDSEYEQKKSRKVLEEDRKHRYAEERNEKYAGGHHSSKYDKRDDRRDERSRDRREKDRIDRRDKDRGEKRRSRDRY